MRHTKSFQSGLSGRDRGACLAVQPRSVLRAAGGMLLAAFTLCAQTQSPPTYSDADLMAWSGFFHWVNWYESIADRDVAQGYSDAAPRGQIQRTVGLTTLETAALKAVAVDWKAQWDAIMVTTRSMMANGATAASPPALLAVRNRRDAMIADHINQLLSALGASHFARLSNYVHLPPRGPTGVTVPWKAGQ
jgi:hypothetical protein